MRTVSHREMRNHSGEILRSVADGETVQVTNNGRLAAVIVPPPADVLADLVARGEARATRRPVADLTQIARRTSRRTAAQILADSRGRW